MSRTVLLQTAETRRSIYTLNKNLPISQEEVKQIVEHALLHTPSSFHSQSTRLVLLLGQAHDKFWDITKNCLQKIVPAENFAPTEQRLAGFKAAAGTVLFYEDQSVIKGLQEKFPNYAENFPIWSEHTSAMHQYALWTTFAAEKVGANLQHYNPVVDEEVAKEWDIPADWKLRAQLVFGGIESPAGEKNFAPIEQRLKVFDAK